MSDEIGLHFHNAMRETRYNYWNALLTLNGIFISVFTASSFFSGNIQYVVFIIILLSVFSCAIIITNYVTAKEIYEHDILPLQAKNFMSVEQLEILERQIAPRIITLNKFVIRSEKTVQVLFILQLIFVLILSLQNVVKGQIMPSP